jgi:hypothetical protein
MNITEYHRDIRRYPMDISKRIGGDGNGTDIGKEMKDGGKAGAEDPIEETTSDLVTGVADHHLRPPDLPEEGTVMTAGLPDHLIADTGHGAQGEGHRAVNRRS